MKIAYLGPEGTFTEKAARNLYPNEELIPFNLIHRVIMAVEEGKVNFGVVPIENFYNGEVRETLDFLTDCSKTKIIREIALSIVHCFGALNDHKPITEIFSKDQALEQCKKFLSENYPDAKTRITTSTSEAARKISEIGILNAGAIASEKALMGAGLEILDKDICQNNRTRFVVLGTESTDPSGDDRTFLVLHPPTMDTPGTLYNTLKFFSDAKINLESIQSRPDGKKGYYFYIELNGHEKDERVKKILKKVSNYLNPKEKYQNVIKVLGSCKNTNWKNEN